MGDWVILSDLFKNFKKLEFEFIINRKFIFGICLFLYLLVKFRGWRVDES